MAKQDVQLAVETDAKGDGSAPLSCFSAAEGIKYEPGDAKLGWLVDWDQAVEYPRWQVPAEANFLRYPTWYRVFGVLTFFFSCDHITGNLRSAGLAVFGVCLIVFYVVSYYGVLYDSVSLDVEDPWNNLTVSAIGYIRAHCCVQDTALLVCFFFVATMMVIPTSCGQHGRTRPWLHIIGALWCGASFMFLYMADDYWDMAFKFDDMTESALPRPMY